MVWLPRLALAEGPILDSEGTPRPCSKTCQVRLLNLRPGSQALTAPFFLPQDGTGLSLP